MSGGVDSSVAAALLLKQGYDVIGATMNLWPRKSVAEADNRHAVCCSLEAVDDARRVADRLGIPHYTLNFRDVFDREVVRNFVEEYARGRTPNPCIRCNRYVKFDALLRKALALGASYVATGHYARIEEKEDGTYGLRKAAYGEKDQSYALYSLTQEQLSHTLFPLGDIPKSETRKIAADLGLVTAEKPESMELCFVTEGDYGQFVAARLPAAARPGPIRSVNGEVLGTHSGVALFTIGQRRGIGVGGKSALYVVDIIPQENTVVVGAREDLYSTGLVAEDVNWISEIETGAPLRVRAKIRYRSTEVPAIATAQEDRTLTVEFDEPQRAVSPGQAVVLYDGDFVVGGGTITRGWGMGNRG